jgi:predicted transposase YbfD/YdcC
MVATALGATMVEVQQTVSFLDHFSALRDPRQKGKVLYPLTEMMLLVLCGVLATAEDFAEIARWGRLNLDFLRRFLPFARGIPSHDALNDVFNALEAEAFRDRFIAWAESLRADAPCVNDGPPVVALDGKTSRRTGDAGKGRSPLHLVSAWASQQRIVLGQEAVDRKENEIVAIPRLLDLLELTGALVTIDAIGCQKQIARKIRDKGADYLLPVKGNQPALQNDIELFFAEQRACAFANTKAFFHQTVDNDHGRLEIRRHWSTSDIDWLKESHPDWTDLTSIGLIERETERAGKVEITLHPYIASTQADAVLLAAAARSHWGIENDLHWSLDVTFHEDLSRLRSAHGPHNMAVVRHIAFNLLKQAKAKGKDSLKITRKKAAWSTDFLQSVIQGTG